MLDRRQVIIGGAAGSLALLMGRLPSLAQITSGPEALRGGVNIFNGSGGTIAYYIGNGGAVIVDSQFPQTAEKCIGVIQETYDEVADALINTHHHADHTGGNETFEPHVDRIIAHKNVPASQKRQATERKNLDKQAYASLTFEKSMRLEVAQEVIDMTHYGPAHTNGDIVVHFENANVVHMGDLVFNRLHPYVNGADGASIANWRVVLDRVLERFNDDTKFIFGHGVAGFGVTGKKADVKVQRDYMYALWAHAEKRVAAGDSREKAQSLMDLPGFRKHQSRGKALTLENCIGVAYDEARKSAN